MTTPLSDRSAGDPGAASYGGRRAFLQAAIAAAAGLACAARPFSSAAATQAPEAGTRELRLIALGDSLTAGYGLPESAAFPAVLEAALRKEGYRVAVVNAGVSGDTASGGLARLDWSLGEGADGAIVELGANDMLRGVDPKITRAALDAILERLQARGVRALLVGMLASANLDETFRAQFDAIYPDLAARRGVLLYPFMLKGVAGRADLKLADGMHPNAEGVATIVRNILPSVRSLLAELGEGAPDAPPPPG